MLGLLLSISQLYIYGISASFFLLILLILPIITDRTGKRGIGSIVRFYSRVDFFTKFSVTVPIIIMLVLALYRNIYAPVLNDSLALSNKQQSELLDTLEAQLKNLRIYQDSLQNPTANTNVYHGRLDTLELKKYIDIQVARIYRNLDSQKEVVTSLRQAINPINPDEILTIARLKDQIIQLNKNVTDLSENIKERQQTFEDAVKREVTASNSSTNLILVVLVPLVLNFLYNVWKDNRKPKEDIQPKVEKT